MRRAFAEMLGDVDKATSELLKGPRPVASVDRKIIVPDHWNMDKGIWIQLWTFFWRRAIFWIETSVHSL